jgi:hypothetical protein
MGTNVSGIGAVLTSRDLVSQGLSSSRHDLSSCVERRGLGFVSICPSPPHCVLHPSYSTILLNNCRTNFVEQIGFIF